ncbi:MAG: alpha/beta hydrolase [Clostridia bacterium]|nr:alpha/beta hydrolase [Clostridia bacterium]
MSEYKLWAKTPLFDESIDQKEPAITPYLIKSNNRSCVIVCPGGGYAMKAEHEGAPIAKWLNSAGINAFVLDYRVSPYREPCPLMDAQRAIRYVRHNAEAFGIDKNKIGILGFSAGGHLAASATVHFEKSENPSDEIDKESSRPDLSILCYPVISTSKAFAHMGSVYNLLGENYSAEKEEYYANEKQVTPETPPVFLWHTANDNGVPVKNSLVFAEALAQNGVPVELHVFPKGAHGLGLAYGQPLVEQWTVLCEKWLSYNGF